MPDMYSRDNYTEESLEAYNAQINEGCALRESWYYDMIEGWNADAVSGGEWDFCWR
ncbi:hypothetical protein [Nocardia colli]|uniref:hypothetical protein n=1 Tax=Nocardia colli TaxID=2545717 RepID=UPI0035D86C97